MEYCIDCRLINSRAELHRALAEALSFPDWYGHNLDALYDMLTGRQEDTALILQNWNPAASAFKGLKTVLTEAAEQNPNFHVFYK